jgi:hypothetical protein
LCGVTEAFRMMSNLNGSSPAAPALRAANGNTDGYALIARGIAAKPNDAGLQFAAALIAADKGDRSRYLDHASKARAGAPGDALLTKNLNHVQ